MRRGMSISLTGKLSVIKLVLLRLGFSGISFLEQAVKNRLVTQGIQKIRDAGFIKNKNYRLKIGIVKGFRIGIQLKYRG